MINEKWMSRQIKRSERFAAQGKFNRAQECLNAIKKELAKQQKELKDNGTDEKQP